MRAYAQIVSRVECYNKMCSQQNIREQNHLTEADLNDARIQITYILLAFSSLECMQIANYMIMALGASIAYAIALLCLNKYPRNQGILDRTTELQCT